MGLLEDIKKGADDTINSLLGGGGGGGGGGDGGGFFGIPAPKITEYVLDPLQLRNQAKSAESIANPNIYSTNANTLSLTQNQETIPITNPVQPTGVQMNVSNPFDWMVAILRLIGIPIGMDASKPTSGQDVWGTIWGDLFSSDSKGQQQLSDAGSAFISTTSSFFQSATEKISETFAGLGQMFSGMLGSMGNLFGSNKLIIIIVVVIIIIVIGIIIAAAIKANPYVAAAKTAETQIKKLKSK